MESVSGKQHAYAVLRGAAVRGVLAELAALRLGVFREWPYLYEGDAAAERVYLETYVAARTAVVVAVREGDRMVGAATALRLDEADPVVARPLVAAGFVPERTMYFGESVVLPAWRGRGIGGAFFAYREAEARSAGADTAVFCRVMRDRADPRRPVDAVALDAFWRRRGYEPIPGITAHFSWRECDAEEDVLHAMEFWSKRL